MVAPSGREAAYSDRVGQGGEPPGGKMSKAACSLVVVFFGMLSNHGKLNVVVAIRSVAVTL